MSLATAPQENSLPHDGVLAGLVLGLPLHADHLHATCVQRGWDPHLGVTQAALIPGDKFSLLPNPLNLTSIFWASSEGLKLDLITTLTSSLVRPTSRTSGITRKGRMMSLVVRYLWEWKA